MHCAWTVSFIPVAMIAVAAGGAASYSAEKSGRLRPPELIRSAHVLTVPLDATVTPPTFSISWWSRVTRAPDVDPPPYVFREAERTDATSRPGVE
ncbi:hypothetical protein RLEG12_20895 [Rhizobium leguminosarum bv. trifolii CB782]|uniref:Secreted protein n=1 Tax=Rhizobium hidalgonense TaxID=1538159 RepID=A0A2A6KLK9_9HYPH|nr:hypothetical protein [Rhizobium hidalgonense]AHG45536.1 hypothetical protein RLEG12_20895 [Rhizobium leguminosarum bv. trifolii CB782]MDR9771285.1 hypothetical protein [Rhizobium hidalgonense]MDR9803667.1 hypothetical protein [Rhizobium hidalgonense]MDR9809160.1 hypothetical protein [Rhizobium hidalgonense]MDR9818685.1 hypothetical protein [Rhizobium hidalgonense]